MTSNKDMVAAEDWARTRFWLIDRCQQYCRAAAGLLSVITRDDGSHCYRPWRPTDLHSYTATELHSYIGTVVQWYSGTVVQAMA